MKPPLKRISIQSLVDDPPQLEEFNECLVIFDDYDSLEGAQSKVVHQLIDDLAILGRHKHLREENEEDAANSIICITHYLTNYKKTRLLLNESTHFVIYPQGTSGKSLNYLLGTHVGMNKDDVQDLKKLKSRWVCVCKQYPQYMISQQTAKILNT